jgi:hypothetical protein
VVPLVGYLARASFLHKMSLQPLTELYKRMSDVKTILNISLNA